MVSYVEAGREQEFRELLAPNGCEVHRLYRVESPVPQSGIGKR
ncbi:hypothetical protein [Bailinhaonella thermotolerans]|nr:hypothetical protein [Bailinhaonella thermotolerans]